MTKIIVRPKNNKIILPVYEACTKEKGTD